MVRYENHCCNCAVGGYPCLGSRCPRVRVKVVYCDFCGKVIDDDYKVNKIDGQDACSACYEKEEFEE